MRLLSIVLCLLILSSPTRVLALDANEEAWVDNPAVDFWVYSVTWQPTFCLMRPDTPGCDQVPQRLLSHGIWPYSKSTENFSNRHPQFCTSSPSCSKEACAMDDQQMKDVLASAPLRALVTEEPKGMFAHEWKKHGTCSGKTMADYFQALVDLRNKVVVIENPRAFDAMIGQSTDFAKVREVFPANTAFRCFKDTDGKQYLHEVFYMIDPAGSPYEGEQNLQIGVQCADVKTWIPRGKAL
ncbi:ribonuclease T2 family protein [Pseudomonas sp. KNUC1026]|uniref:ribonuclease T2 family protein n=1 Tax=Pseudomonas sp. KNUC1026 TaxID=2893890 RepID=UPI001F3FA802|nr:hypothetical protein [Pseudomonas sp. KNUC1026]UFH50979.1 hypothetical protein LN139_07875 [Pseudomonas sp. KNUC1026]